MVLTLGVSACGQTVQGVGKDIIDMGQSVVDMGKTEKKSDDDLTKILNHEKKKLLSMGGKDQKENRYNSTSGHIIKTIYYTTAIIIMGIYLTKLN